jgi:leucyl aminopeptidase
MVGKGITFDSGGISLKAPGDMLRMKGDMAGAGAVLAAIEAISSLGLPLDVVAVLAIAENMPGSSALRPGDVLVSACGKTVEVVNTDCEGRLVLADALTYARRQGANLLVDVATLTIPDPLGHLIIAATSNDDDLWSLVQSAAHIAGEHVHRFPMIPEWRDVIRSDAADLSNGFYTEARTSTAGMFLSEFVDSAPWVHLDIAGPAWNDNRELLALPRGPLGAGSRTLVRVAELLCISDGPDSYGVWAARGLAEDHAEGSPPHTAATTDHSA